jgi:hypothetical protein
MKVCIVEHVMIGNKIKNRILMEEEITSNQEYPT